MDGSIAQTLGLAMHGNAFLQGRTLGRFWPEASFFRFCREVRFLAVDAQGEELEVEPDPTRWLHSLHGRCEGLQLSLEARNDPRFSDMITVGFVGGGSHWRIGELGAAELRIWEEAWSVADANADDGRIWSVVYRGVPAVRDPRAAAANLDRSEAELGDALEAIASFAERIGSDWSGTFRRALGCLRGEATCQSPCHPDLAPPGLLSPQAQRLLTACEIGWVFGGMGSWNDGAYEGDEGTGLSETLFDRLQAGLADVANSTLPALSR